MLIQEAIKARTADKPFITRQQWVEDMAPYPHKAVKILPTNSPDCCIATVCSERNPCRGWQPTAEDLVAEDWEPFS